MRGFIRRKLAALTGCTSGNATLIVALGMPMLIGGAGLGVDLAQWYMWKRELQFAVDQAAMAGAWARSDSATEATYVTRATQEFNANLAATEGDTTAPVVELANYAGGTGNSVAVHATVSHELPFSGLLTGNAPNIYAYAQAVYEEGNTFTSCLIAVDEDADGAITIGGSSILTASCGLAALSNSGEAITVNGEPTVDAGWILAAGGIDDWLKENTDDTIMENMSGLYDPFEDLSPPNPTETQVARTYTCVANPGVTTADRTVTTAISYSYKRGSNSNNWSDYDYQHPRTGSSTSASSTQITVPTGTTAGTTSSTSTSSARISGNGQNAIWEVTTTVTSTTYSNIVITGATVAGSVQPGTYSNIKVSCNSVFSTGVYVIDGGGLEIDGQYSVTGSGVMFVLKNGAYIKINGGANINLTAIQASDLMSKGIPSDQANLLAGMLVFEDRESEGTSKNNINGNAATVLNGTMYFPKSNVDFEGTASVTSQCLMIAAATINITGNANMSTFCPADSSEDTVVATTVSNVKLIA